MSEITKEFGKSLSRLRKRRGWTQERLAEKANLSRNFIGLLENSKRAPRLGTTEQLANALGIEISELLSPLTATVQDMVPPGMHEKKRDLLLRIIRNIELLDLPKLEILEKILQGMLQLVRQSR